MMPNEAETPTNVFFYTHTTLTPGDTFERGGRSYRVLGRTPFPTWRMGGGTAGRKWRIDAIEVPQVDPPPPRRVGVDVQGDEVAVLAYGHEVAGQNIAEERVIDSQTRRRLMAQARQISIAWGQVDENWRDIRDLSLLEQRRAGIISRRTFEADYYGGEIMTMEESERRADPRRRALDHDERRFMLRHCGRLEAELRHLVATNPTVRQAWSDALAGGLSETSAAELALVCLARENADLRRELVSGGRRATMGDV